MRLSHPKMLCALLTIFACGCGQGEPKNVIAVAPGVVFRRDTAQGVQILDVDLLSAKVRPVVVASDIKRKRNNFIGDAKTVIEWAEEFHAVGGMNAGFFGDTYDTLGRRKQIVNLAMVNGQVVAPGAVEASTKRPGEHFVRSVVGFKADGTPEIAWAAGGIQTGTLRRYSAPVNPPPAENWLARSAVACGPRLFAGGARRISDRDERLVSPGRVSRAFIAYDRENGVPRHLILGRADAMEFSDVAAYLSDYFSRVHSTSPREAMCLDGGPSAQVVFRNESGRLEDAEPTGVFVPTAILLVPR